MQFADIDQSLDKSRKGDLYVCLIETFQCEVKRPLTGKEKAFLNWMAEKQVSIK